MYFRIGFIKNSKYDFKNLLSTLYKNLLCCLFTCNKPKCTRIVVYTSYCKYVYVFVVLYCYMLHKSLCDKAVAKLETWNTIAQTIYITFDKKINFFTDFQKSLIVANKIKFYLIFRLFFPNFFLKRQNVQKNIF